MKFDKYLDALLSEKGIDLSTRIQIEGPSGINDMALQDVVDAMKSTNESEKKEIKEILVKIDFQNGNILNFIKHLAQAIAL